MEKNVENIKEKERINYFDNLKGILIFLVVFGHMLYNVRNDSYVYSILIKTIYIFHMPAFAFISGYFSKKRFESKKIFKYIFYYIIFSIPLMLFDFIIKGEDVSLLTPYYSMWYIVALIIWRVTSKYIGNIKGTIIISFIIALLIGFNSEVNNIFAVSRIITFYPFFIAGYKLQKKTVESHFLKKSFLKSYMGVILFATLAIISLKFVQTITFEETLMDPYKSTNDILNRMIIIILASCFIYASLLIVQNKKIIGITKFGEKSLYIYLYHRIIVLCIPMLYSFNGGYITTLLIFIIISLIICMILSIDFISNITEKLFDKVYESFANNNSSNIIIKYERNIVKCIALFMILIILFMSGWIPFNKKNAQKTEQYVNQIDKIYNVISDNEKKKIDDSLSILFVGDLILLQEQVKRGYNEKTKLYNYDDVFEYTKTYINKADLSVGVFEGPMASEEKEYSNSDFNDNTKLYLNYPDEFGESVKNAGFDLVTLANNHMLDKGQEGLNRTIDVLDCLNISHTGGYKDENERNNVKIIEKEGLKIGILSYTYGCNYYSEEELINKKTIPLLVDKDSKYYSTIKKKVKDDFDKIKSKNPDTIIVLPHMGTQFSTEVDEFQENWNQIFVDLGANVILGDHAHAVEPIYIKKNKEGEEVIIVNCPGNFVNSYVDNNGDATSMVEIYLDKSTGKVNGSSIIPMWVQSKTKGNYRALPLYEIMTNDKLKKEISTYELNRIEEVCKLITKVMINEELSLDMIQEKLYFMNDGYKRQKAKTIDINKNSPLVKEISKADSVCFIGDSITEGTKNGGYGWYEPLINSFENKQVENVSKGGATTKTIIDEYSKNRKEADLYVIAIGCNDIRYRDKSICAMNEEEYIVYIEKLIDTISNKDKATFAFIAPWISTTNDTELCKVDLTEKEELYNKYTSRLEKYCKENGHIFINPNKTILNALKKEQYNKYLVDYIHPNVRNGIKLYSEAVIEANN